jgi:cysteine desulfurase
LPQGGAWSKLRVAMDPADPIYLDHNATTPLLPQVVEAMLPFLTTEFGNPSSSHPLGKRAREAVEAARAHVAQLLGCDADEILFTSGGTEANNLAIRGVAEASARRRQCVTSVIEHPATANPCRYLERHGWTVEWLPVDPGGRALLDVAEGRVSEATALVTVMHANNETGTIQPLRELAALARRHGALVHTDAAQSVGKIPVDVGALDVDLLTVAGHKLNAPKGVGALYVRRGTELRPFLLGAGHERGLRPGTENVASIVALGRACELAHASLETRMHALAALRDRLWSVLHAAIPGLERNGDASQCLPNTLSVRFPGVRGTQVLEATPAVAASTGSACHEGHESPSGVLVAMGLGADLALQTVRLSVGNTTAAQEIDVAAAALIRGWKRERDERGRRS